MNEELIPFNYQYKFKGKGKYIIKYIFNENITNISLIFYTYTSLTKIDLSNLILIMFLIWTVCFPDVFQ